MRTNSQVYIQPPKDAMNQGVSIFYREPQDVRTVVFMSKSLASDLSDEMRRNQLRYKVNNRLSISEVIRSLLMVGLRLRDTDTKLFHHLRDF